MEMGHEYVDLGLGSGRLWAACNVGAVRPEECGDYFAWGEVRTKREFTEFNNRWFGKYNETLVRKGVMDGEARLTPRYDVVTQQWGERWRMPTMEEFEELIGSCRRGFGDGVLRLVGGNGNVLILPLGGTQIDGKLVDKGRWGTYWTSTANEDGTSAWYGGMRWEVGVYTDYYLMYYGRSVRGVVR